ncbi:selenocysteine-specific translation elongation factor [Corynebacterium stationis]|uniref:selenocysteine-specific translation elongation factor n=1 Tax=Corynebacterium stationis TaxID=1705 RepID=UPI00076F68A6|nr:selenocysteine-specific translation elongation factor [Corynebacterium stationis]AMJ44927.1 translation elongation factor [Corynebacterium stationis]AQX71380.1 selenocysteine-specific translation elongation factor [Corynebacterium stationis]ASJ19066.1 selenocysteine-specific translation elongation factor [Corynebacterium stationis]
MYVIATAGHVDHGKSTLVNALTTMDPDRWEEEKQRGLTIDLGFAWTTLKSGADVAFVDVPGHERFIANTLAGLGPAPAVMLVIAADEGWKEQTSEHLEAIDALGIERGIIVLTRMDNGQRISEANVRDKVAGTSLSVAPIFAVSARTGEGMEEVRGGIDKLLPADEVLQQACAMPARMWIDRAFSIKGAGTVVTGTWAAGSVKIGEHLKLVTASGEHDVTVRGLHSENSAVDKAEPVMRLALNLRGVDADAISRGDVLTEAESTWWQPEVIDVRWRTGPKLDGVPRKLNLHVGTASVPVHVRGLDAEHARLTLQGRAFPLRLGDRLALRGPGLDALAGVEVVDMDPPLLNRRGAPVRRAQALRDQNPFDASAYVARKEAVMKETLAAAGFDVANKPASLVEFRSWWVNAQAIARWTAQLRTLFDTHLTDHHLSDGLPLATALSALALPDDSLVSIAVAGARLKRDGGIIRDPHAAPRDLGPAEKSVAIVEAQLAKEPFVAPDASTLDELGLGPIELAAAERAGRLLRVGPIVLLPSAPQQAAEILGQQPGEFTLSQARQALGTTRRVAVPLLEYMDARGLTRRTSDSARVLKKTT